MMWSSSTNRPLPAGPEGEEARQYLRKSSLMYLELLAGSGALDEARQYAGQMVIYYGSAEMRDLMQQRLARAGQPDLLAPKP